MSLSPASQLVTRGKENEKETATLFGGRGRIQLTSHVPLVSLRHHGPLSPQDRSGKSQVVALREQSRQLSISACTLPRSPEFQDSMRGGRSAPHWMPAVVAEAGGGSHWECRFPLCRAGEAGAGLGHLDNPHVDIDFIFALAFSFLVQFPE